MKSSEFVELGVSGMGGGGPMIGEKAEVNPNSNPGPDPESGGSKGRLVRNPSAFAGCR